MKIYASSQSRLQWSDFAGKDYWVKVTAFNSSLAMDVESWVKVIDTFDSNGYTRIICNIMPGNDDFLDVSQYKSACDIEYDVSEESFSIIYPLEIFTDEEMLEICQANTYTRFGDSYEN